MQEHELIIAGGGPAGLSAGIYAARSGMKALLLEKGVCGGQMLWTETIENFPGFPEGIGGFKLGEQFREQALKAGLHIATEEVKEIAADIASGMHLVKTEEQSYASYSVILATGAIPKKLGIPGEDKFVGKGVSFCATCDGPLFSNKEVVVIGGGNAACEEALFLSKFAKKVTLVHRRDQLRADQVFQDRLEANPKTEIVWNAQVEKILGEGKLTGVRFKDKDTAQQKEIPCDGVFIFVGVQPNTAFMRGVLKTDDQGFIITDSSLRTSKEGIFACGDCRLRGLRQIVTACAEGAQAAVSACNYVEEIKKKS